MEKRRHESSYNGQWSDQKYTYSLQLLLLQQQETIKALTLPQPGFPVFNGDLIEYCDFIRAFENPVEPKTSSSSARLYYLLQSTSRHVQDLGRSCLAIRDIGYSEARRLLAERYGQPLKIATAYVDRVMNAQPIRAEEDSQYYLPAVQTHWMKLATWTALKTQKVLEKSLKDYLTHYDWNERRKGS